MLRADIARLRCRSGTILGREVVPDVCRTSASSSPAGLRRPERSAPSATKSMAMPDPCTVIMAMPFGAAAWAMATRFPWISSVHLKGEVSRTAIWR